MAAKELKDMVAAARLPKRGMPLGAVFLPCEDETRAAVAQAEEEASLLRTLLHLIRRRNRLLAKQTEGTNG